MNATTISLLLASFVPVLAASGAAQDGDREAVMRCAREWSASVQKGPEAYASFLCDWWRAPPQESAQAKLSNHAHVREHWRGKMEVHMQDVERSRRAYDTSAKRPSNWPPNRTPKGHR
jgi:hypothetical protein